MTVITAKNDFLRVRDHRYGQFVVVLGELRSYDAPLYPRMPWVVPGPPQFTNPRLQPTVERLLVLTLTDANPEPGRFHY